MAEFEKPAEGIDGVPGGLDLPIFPRLKLRISRLAHSLADLVLPPVCLSCHEPLASNDALCPCCWSQVSFIRPPLCDRLGIPMPFDTGGIMISAAASAYPPVYGRARAVASYDGLMRDLVQSFKFHDRHDARRLFVRWLSEAGGDLLREADTIVPVPLHRLRLLSRRFNQAAILECELAKKNGLNFAPGILVRKRRTPRQVGLTSLERRKNVAGAFLVSEPNREKLRGRRIVLIDDVITTGATVNACARALLRGGAANVDVLTLAIVTGNRTVST